MRDALLGRRSARDSSPRDLEVVGSSPFDGTGASAAAAVSKRWSAPRLRCCACRARWSVASVASMLAVATIGALVHLSFKAAADASHGGRFFAAQALVLVQLVPLVIMVAVKRILKDPRVSPTEKKATSLSQWNYAAMGLLDMVHAQLFWVTGGVLHAALVLVLTQIQLPVAMVLSSIVICARFEWQHTLGAALVALGVAISIVPSALAAVGVDTPLAVSSSSFFGIEEEKGVRPQPRAVETLCKAALFLIGAAIASCSSMLKETLLNPPLRALRARVGEADDELAKMNADFDLYYAAKEGKVRGVENILCVCVEIFHWKMNIIIIITS